MSARWHAQALFLRELADAALGDPHGQTVEIDLVAGDQPAPARPFRDPGGEDTGIAWIDCPPGYERGAR